MHNIETNICEAIELLVNSSLDKAKYDKTIQGTIISCEDELTGYYKIKYQDSLFYAYATEKEQTYTNGSLVYILVPNGDFSQDKIILGKTDKMGGDYIPSVEEKDKYEFIGNNIIITNEQYNLSSYAIQADGSSYVEMIYPNKALKIDVTAANEYLRQSPSMLIGASFKTKLPEEQKYQGNYGIIFGLDFYKNYDDSNREIVTRYYSIDVNSMKGNPYNFENSIEQYRIFDIDGNNFKQISSIALFVKDFPHSDKNFQNKLDILVDNIQLLGAVKSKDTIQDFNLILDTPQGSFFDKGALPNDSKIINANLKIKGKIANPESNNIKFYWFKEDLSVDMQSKYYNQYGGIGWKCLNNFNLIKDEGQENGQVEWIADKNSYQVYCKDLFEQSTTFKCVAVYNNNSYKKQIVIKKLSEQAIVSIESDSGTEFYYDLGNPTLTCLVDKVVQKTFSYQWAVEDKYHHITKLSNTSYQLKVSIADITDFATYKCSAYNNENILVGTGEITLTNSYQEQGAYNLVINEGSQNFQYDEEGVSPASPAKDSPIVIPQLSFSIYDNQGQLLTDILDSCSVEWKVPATNTMITDISQADNMVTEDNDIDYDYFVNTKVLNYQIRNKYRADYKNNTIQLTVKYKKMVLVAYTNLTFIKQGEQGTNGTSYTCKIVPLRGSYEDFPLLTVYEDKGAQYAYFNFGSKNNKTFIKGLDTQNKPINGATAFKVELYEGGEKIFSGVESAGNVSVEWSILKNTYKTLVKDVSNLTISKKDGIITYIDVDDLNPANIIQCAVTITDSNKLKTEVTTSMPIAISKVLNPNYQIKIQKNTGFRYVNYTSDGMNPQYNDVNPFILEIIGAQPNSYLWSLAGQVYVGNNFIHSNDLIIKDKELNKNSLKVVPANQYNGLCVNNAIYCRCQGVGTIHIPIHLLLNRYGQSHLNGWNGNSIQLNEEGGYILSPQIGAGRKDINNSFTGVLMGEVQEADKKESDIGLFGYKEGQRTFSLDSETGVVTLGAQRGRMSIDPSQNQALLYSQDFWKNYDEKTGLPSSYAQSNKNNQGMLIDLTSPAIEFGNGCFKVDSKGLSMKFNSSSDDVESTLNNSIKSVINQYALSTSKTEMLLVTDWINYPPATEKGKFLWQKTITIYNDNHSDEKYVCLSGADGEDGKTFYIHIAYANTIDNSDKSFTTEDPQGRAYIYMGRYEDNNIKDSQNPNDYKWSLIKGLDGHDGNQGLPGKDGQPGRDGEKIVKLEILNLNISKNNFKEYSKQGHSVTWQDVVNTKDLKLDDIGLIAGVLDTGQKWSIYGKITSFYANTVITSTISSTIDGISYYTHVAWANDENGNGFSSSIARNEDGTDKKYIGIYTDIEKEDSQNYQDYQWSKYIGDNGAQGIPGKDGYSLHIAYMDTLNNLDNSFSVKKMYKADGAPKKYIGQYTDRKLEDSQNYQDYQWSKYIGDNGENTYFHVAYANKDINGKIIDFSTSDNNSRAYIGQYVDRIEKDSEDPDFYTWTRIEGKDGQNGVGINSVTTSYMINNSNITPGKNDPNWIPLGPNDAFPKVEPGKYLWIRTVTDYTDDSMQDTVTITFSKDGKNGQDGQDGSSITIVSIEYQAGESATERPIGQWSKSIPAVPKDQYLWTKTTFSDGQSAYGISKQGSDGVGIDKVLIDYATTQALVDPKFINSWNNQMPNVPEKEYLWTRTITDYTNGTDTVTYTYSRMGENGRPGEKGQAGTNVRVKSISYQVGNSATAPPKGRWIEGSVPKVPNGQYLWTKTVLVEDSNPPKEKEIFSVSRQGEDGIDGKSIVMIETGVTMFTKADIDKLSVFGHVDTWRIKNAVTVKVGDICAVSGITKDTQHNWTIYGEATSVDLSGPRVTMKTVSSVIDGKNGQDGKDAAIVSTVPPADTNQLWCDTSVDPPVIKRFNGIEWVIVNDQTSFIEETRKSFSDIVITQNGISGTVTRIQQNVKDGFDNTNGQIADITNLVNAKLDADGFEVNVGKIIDTHGVNKVDTGKGFRFDENGLSISQKGSEMSTLIDNDGMKVSKSGQVVLTADNKGVDAVNLHASTYLIIGNNSRFEDYGADRTGCFWIGR